MADRIFGWDYPPGVSANDVDGAWPAGEYPYDDDELVKDEWKAAAAIRTVKKHNLGSVAYSGYLERTGGKSLISGVELPLWEELPGNIMEAWNWAARAVVINHLDTEGWAE